MVSQLPPDKNKMVILLHMLLIWQLDDNGEEGGE